VAANYNQQEFNHLLRNALILVGFSTAFIEQSLRRLAMRISLLLLAAPLFLIACSTTSPPPNLAKEAKPTPIIKKDFARILEGNFRGLFSFGNGQGYFKACNTNKEFSVNNNLALRNIYEQLTSTPYTPVYIEFTGEITFSKPSQDKENTLMRIDRVHHMALAKASLQCAKAVDNFLFKAQGDDPYWRINIDKDHLFFSTKASNQSYDVKDANFRTTQINHINTVNKKGQRLKLTIQPGHCYNLKNREYWGYTTSVTSQWGEYLGCGEPGWPIEDQAFTGYYLSTSNHITTNLTLHANYTAEYKEKINDIETIKTGFWKSNSPKQVVVMLSKAADKTIRQELTLQREHLALTVAEINDSNIVTPIANEALIFNKMNAKEGIESVKLNHVERIFTARNISPDNHIDINIQTAVNGYFKIHRTDPKNSQFSAVKYDLNGDGIDEAIVLLDWCSDRQSCEMLIFEGRKDGYRFSSRISNTHLPIIISKTQRHRWQSLLVKHGTTWSQLTFDGLSYPTRTTDLERVNKEDYSTNVVLFFQGKPTQWFPIQM